MSVHLYPIAPYMVKNDRGTVHIVDLKQRGGPRMKMECGLRGSNFDTVDRDMDNIEQYEQSLCKRCKQRYE